MPVHGLSTVFRSALAGYLKHLANESAKHGVTVNSVCPASIATPTFMARADAADRAKTMPMQRLGKPEECAAAAVFSDLGTGRLHHRIDAAGGRRHDAVADLIRQCIHI